MKDDDVVIELLKVIVFVVWQPAESYAEMENFSIAHRASFRADACLLCFVIMFDLTSEQLLDTLAT